MYELMKKPPNASHTIQKVKSTNSKQNTSQSLDPLLNSYNIKNINHSNSIIQRKSNPGIIQRMPIGTYTEEIINKESGVRKNCFFELHHDASNKFEVYEEGISKGYLIYKMDMVEKTAYIVTLSSHLSGMGTFLIHNFAISLPSRIQYIQIDSAALTRVAQTCYERAGFLPDKSLYKDLPEAVAAPLFDSSYKTVKGFNIKNEVIETEQRKGVAWGTLIADTNKVIVCTRGIMSKFKPITQIEGIILGPTTPTLDPSVVDITTPTSEKSTCC